MATDLRIDPITDKADFPAAFACTVSTFGHQTHDGVWIAFNPSWDTPSGQEAGAQRMADRWSSATRDRNGDLNTVFLKATVPDPENPGQRVIAGMAIWVQASMVDGYGDRPVENIAQAMDLNTLYPEQQAEHRYLIQCDRALHKRRIQVIKEKANASPPAVMVLDLCAVDPKFQRRGIAGRLTQWGLDEAQRRGGLEAITEASSMGRHVYLKRGFKPENGDEEIEYDVDEEFKGREWPSNLFLRTGNKE